MEEPGGNSQPRDPYKNITGGKCEGGRSYLLPSGVAGLGLETSPGRRVCFVKMRKEDPSAWTVGSEEDDLGKFSWS